MRILLTGATGFIGGYLLEHLARTHDVFALAREVPEDGRGAEWVRHDLTEPLEAARLPERIDAVVHLAQSRRYREFPEGARDIFAINVASTFELLEYARRAGAESFLFASTGGVYAHSYEKLAETDPVLPLNFYLNSKYAAELLVGNYRRFFRTVVFRLFFVYGPGQERMLIPSLLDRVARGQTVTVDGSPGLRINPIYVEDAVRVFEPALAIEGSDLFNVAGDDVVAVGELVRLVGDVVGVEPAIEHAAGREEGDLIGDNARMKSILGVVPTTSLEEGLRATFAARGR